MVTKMFMKESHRDMGRTFPGVSSSISPCEGRQGKVGQNTGRSGAAPKRTIMNSKKKKKQSWRQHDMVSWSSTENGSCAADELGEMRDVECTRSMVERNVELL
jgi:hypothetical protein